jgi:hypothetical protein
MKALTTARIAYPQVLWREQLSHLHALLSLPTRAEIEWVADDL